MKRIAIFLKYFFFGFVSLCILAYALYVIGGSVDFVVPLGNDYFYDEENEAILGLVEIQPNVISFNYDSRYIIAKQIPESFYNDAYFKQPSWNYKMGLSCEYYWIIDKIKDVAYGPLLKNEYLDSIRVLHINISVDEDF